MGDGSWNPWDAGAGIAPPRITQTSFGRMVEVVGGWLDATQTQPTTQETSLIDANLGELVPGDELSDGSWVLTVSAEALDWPAPVAPNGNSRVCPLIARVQFGSGGAMHIAELDVVPGFVIHVPAQTVRVDLFWDRLPVPSTMAALWAWALPGRVQVRATLHRGVVSAYGKRTYMAARSPGGTVSQGPIPPFARSVMVYGDEPPPAGPGALYAAGSRFSLASSSPAFAIWQSFSGAQLYALKNMGAGIPLNGQASRWTLVMPGTDYPTVIDFEVEI